MIIPKSLLRETVQIQPLTGNSALGPVFGETVQAQCSFEPENRRITNTLGQEVTACARAFFLPDAPVKIGDAIIWQGAFYQVVDVRQMRPNGIAHHLDVYLASEAGQPS